MVLKSRRTGQVLPADDIPVAERLSPMPSVPKGHGLRGILLVVGGALVAVIGALQLPMVRTWLAPQLAPGPVAGLDARQSPDGRLLGHFPYPEADPELLVSVEPGLQLHRDAATALTSMLRAAEDDGVSLSLLSAFRSKELQKDIFFGVKAERNQNARERAEVSAPPGFSEHSTGYAVDLGDGRLPQTNLSPRFEETPAFRWLEQNAARYHFTLSFPRDNPQGVSYEPWHWRFEGTAEALQVFEPAQQLSR
nr:M15 family metallopeptidase [Cyanobium sp. PCC 7001]